MGGVAVITIGIFVIVMNITGRRGRKMRSVIVSVK
jgi:hypothetical protein